MQKTAREKIKKRQEEAKEKDWEKKLAELAWELCINSVLVTWPRMLPDGIITDVTGHEKTKTHEVTLN